MAASVWNSKYLITVLEIWKGATDNNKAFGALLTDLSKAFQMIY